MVLPKLKHQEAPPQHTGMVPFNDKARPEIPAGNQERPPAILSFWPVADERVVHVRSALNRSRRLPACTLGTIDAVRGCPHIGVLGPHDSWKAIHIGHVPVTSPSSHGRRRR